LTKGRIAGGGRIFHRGELNVTPAIREQWSRLQQSRWRHYRFLLRTPQHWLTMLFNGPDNPENCPLPLKFLDESVQWLYTCTRGRTVTMIRSNTSVLIHRSSEYNWNIIHKLISCIFVSFSLTTGHVCMFIKSCPQLWNLFFSLQVSYAVKVYLYFVWHKRWGNVFNAPPRTFQAYLLFWNLILVSVFSDYAILRASTTASKPYTAQQNSRPA